MLTRRPPDRNSGAPASSQAMCATSWQSTMPAGFITEASDSELAAVPVATKKTETSCSNTSENQSTATRVWSSAP